MTEDNLANDRAAGDAVPPTPYPSVDVPAARPPVDPLTEEQYAMIRAAHLARRPVLGTARVARRSAAMIFTAGVLGVPFVLFSPTFMNLAVVATLFVIGYLEHAGARRVARCVPEAASHLGYNQLIFCGLIVVYCVDSMLQTPTSQLSPEVRNQLSQVGGFEGIESMINSLTYLVYGTVIVVSVAVQGGLAVYYFSRRRRIEAVRQATPSWIRRLMDELSE